MDLEIRRSADGGIELIDHDPVSATSAPSPIMLDKDDTLRARLQTMWGTNRLTANSPPMEPNC
ncbi:MAG TPA: hypothetical protein VLZ12_03070 [Verrucomicrobiae bacterium]|nr:hypothetical protein [Verrucomicrobiae bacterium]